MRNGPRQESASKSRYYFLGNAAKSRIVREILDCNRHASVFDYGAGSGGDWARVLLDHPGLRLSLYEPRLSSRHAMVRYFEERALADRVTVLTHLGELDAAGYDFVTSFSVLEHVWDRRSICAPLSKPSGTMASST
jgi:2-polyprenyl-3-methyl-5-hydroxy-6-metoxy-1,4-benzoquinol methylase